MSEQQLFDLVIIGHDSTHANEVLVSAILDLLNERSSELELKLAKSFLVTGSKVKIREGIGIKEATLLQQRLSNIAVKTEICSVISANKTNDAVYICPACNHQQPKNEQIGAQQDVCESCGTVGERYNRKLRLQEVISRERQRYEADRAKTVRTVGEENMVDDEESLLDVARQHLVLQPAPKRPAKKITGLLVIVALGVGAGTFYYWSTLQNPIPSTPVTQQVSTQQQGKAGPVGKSHLSNPPSQIAPVLTSKNEPVRTKTNVSNVVPTAQNTANNAQTDAILASYNDPNPQKMFAPTETMIKAFAELDDAQLLASHVGFANQKFGKDRQRIQQLLKLGERALADTIIASVTDPYPRSLVLLDLAQWEYQQKQFPQAQQTLGEIQRMLDEANTLNQQVLLLGALSKGYLTFNERSKAGEHLRQALEKIMTLPKGSAQVDLLMKLASEQALLGNGIAARQLLKIVEPLVQSAGELRSTKLIQVISIYALVGDFTEVKKRLPQLDNATQRDKITALIANLEKIFN